MNIDAAVRYYPVVEFLKRENREGKTVLEVGSGTKGLAEYYTGKVVGVDSDFSKTEGDRLKNITLVEAAITKIPFKDGIFKYVVCMDTLEHLPKNIRQKAIQELLRVTKSDGIMLVGFPSSNLSSTFEKAINNFFKLVQGRDHPWLTEHIANGLPEVKELKFELSSMKSIKIYGNCNLFIWFLMHLFFTVLNLKMGQRLFYKFAKALNLPPYYRKLIVIKK